MMVEQVARAIEEQCAGCDPRDSSAFIDAARAAIAAMREPSREMLSAAQGWSYRLYGKSIGDEAARGCLRAMIDAALTEG